MGEANDDDDHPLDRLPKYPSAFRFAGIVWICFGVLILINTAVVVLFLVTRDPVRGGVAAVVGGVFVPIIGVLFAAVFISAGTRSIRGTARDALGIGIVSIIFGLLDVGSGGWMLAGGEFLIKGAELVNFLWGLISLSAGMVLVIAGFLALGARAKYQAWRQARKHQLSGRRHNDD